MGDLLAEREGAGVSYVLYGVWYVACGVVGVLFKLKLSSQEFRGAVL